MPKGSSGPLKDAQDAVIVIKKKAEELLSECTCILEDSTIDSRPSKLKDLYQRCVDTGKETEELLQTVEKLNKKNESTKVKDFAGKKINEIKSLQEVMDKLEIMGDKLEPDEVEDEYYKKVNNNELGTDDEATEEGEESVEDEEDFYKDDDEEYEDEEDVEEEEEETEEETEDEGVETDGNEENDEGGSEENDDEKTPKIIQYQALSAFDGEQEDDLSFAEGDILTLIGIREDGWWECEDKDGKSGLVPSTYLQQYNKYKDIQTPETEEDDDDDEMTSPRSGKVLWSSIKKAVKETSATDVLHAMGALPSGFRASTLSKILQEGDDYTEDYTMVNFLSPKLSTSNLSYKDLFFNPTSNKIRSRPVRVQRVITLQACRQIPTPGTGLTILSRHIRMCLFDGKKVLSNIIALRAQCTDKEQRTWTFQSKLTDALSSLDFSDFFIRCSGSEANVGILFELCISYKRQKTDEESEFSCGWVHLPVFNEDGTPIANKSFDLMVNGGTPYEKGVEVDPTISRRATSNPLKSLMSKNKQPRLVFKVAVPTKEQKDLLDTLPEVLIGNMANLTHLSFYRQILADVLLRDKIELNSTELIHSPFLTSFPAVTEQPDLMDAVRVTWNEKVRISKKADKRDNEYMKDQFRQVFLETAYPLDHSAYLPPFKIGNDESVQKRQTEITAFLQTNKEKNTVLVSLLSSECSYEPFDMSELAFDVQGQYCLTK